MRRKAIGDASQCRLDEDVSWATEWREYLSELIGVD